MSRAGFYRYNNPDFSDPHDWQERVYFWGVKNRELSSRTGEFSNCDPEGTHPVFILRRIERDSFRFCACSSRKFNFGTASYIRKGARTKPHQFFIKENTFILHFIFFNLTLTDKLIDRLPLHGLVSEEDIEGNFHKQGGVE